MEFFGRTAIEVYDLRRQHQIALLVLPRRDDSPLHSGQHPVATDSRVEMDVYLIHLEHRFAG
jgi:hypothetical protein